MISLLLAAAVSGVFDAGRAMQLIERANDEIKNCVEHNPRGVPSKLEFKPLSQSPNLVLVTAGADGYCLCFAQNCPFWVYRMSDTAATEIVEDAALWVTAIPTSGPVPDIDYVAHESALFKVETRLTFRNGKYVEAQTWRIRISERKPDSVPLRFAPGASSALLSGKIAADWGDKYTFDARAGQTLEISNVQSERIAIVRLAGGKLDEVLRAGHPVTLPAGGSYAITVDQTNVFDPVSTYSFTISIH